MEIIIRAERPEDYPAVFDVTEKAFKEMEFADGDEQFLVGRLRNSDVYIPELSLVAEMIEWPEPAPDSGKQGGSTRIVGHIMLTHIRIIDGETRHNSLCLAPVSVLPEFHKMGIGSKLIEAAHDRARKMGFGSCTVVGHSEYYPRFGYEPMSKYGITITLEAPDECCMAIELLPGGLNGLKGVVQFPKEFFEKEQ